MPLSVARGWRRPGDRWTEQDWLLAQAWSDLDRMRCPDCNTPLYQAFDPELERRWAADLPLRCHPCTAIAHRQKDYTESDAPHALRFPVHLR